MCPFRRELVPSSLRSAALACTLGLLAAGGPAAAAPTLRVQAEQRGDFLIFGNTVGFDCQKLNPVPNPLVGVVNRDACGAEIDDTAIDVFWRSDEPAAGLASLTFRPEDARSTAVLALPDGAVVTYARIYWSGGLLDGAQAGKSLLVERPGVFSQAITADTSLTADAGTNGPGSPMGGRGIVYQSSADITRLLQRHGAGPYRVGGIAHVPIQDKRIEVTQMVWSVVVFYRRDADPPRNLAIFDGLEKVEAATPASATLTGFVVPQMNFDAKLGLIAYEGDFDTVGDFIQVNDQKLSNALNPENNFFNATRSRLGSPVSLQGDLPQMSGQPGSMNGYDIDVVDMNTYIRPGDTKAVLSARTVNDIYFLGAFVTSVGTFKPLFTGTQLGVTDLTAPGRFAPGDELEFTLETANSGNDAGTGAVVEIQLPPGVSYLPGTIEILSGNGAGQKSDLVGDDQCEYLPGTRTVRCRIGKGADGRQGGTVAPDEGPIKLRFRGRIDDNAKGKLVTQAVVTASGAAGAQLGIPPYRFLSTDVTATGAASPTVIVIAECDGNAQCAGKARGTACTAERVCGCAAQSDCIGGATCDVLSGQCVLPAADLRVTVTANPERPSGLVPAAYTVEVRNAGPGTAPGARVVVTLPPGSTVENLAGEGWSCTREGDQLICVYGKPIGPNQQAPNIVFSALPGPTPGTVIVIEAAGGTGPGGGPANPDGIVVGDPDVSNNVVVRDFDGAGVFRAAGGGFGCRVAPWDERAGSAAALLTLLCCGALGLRRRRR